VTRQQDAILSLLGDLDDFRSAQDLQALLRDRGQRVGLTTVYRALSALAADERVDVMRPPGGEHMYRLCQRDEHHHHLICRECGRTVEVEGPAVERWIDRIADENGFTDVSHTLDVFGRCADCSR
jgi:Fur family ferric uptake transcriptional regulator